MADDSSINSANSANSANITAANTVIINEEPVEDHTITIGVYVAPDMTCKKCRSCWCSIKRILTQPYKINHHDVKVITLPNHHYLQCYHLSEIEEINDQENILASQLLKKKVYGSVFFRYHDQDFTDKDFRKLTADMSR